MPTLNDNNLYNILENGVKDFLDSAAYKNFLSVMSRFHNYSYNNNILIAMQKPDATYLAGYVKWKSLNRHVNKGEKGLSILAPCPYKTTAKVKDIDPITQQAKVDENGNTIFKEIEIIKPIFKPVTVFDISQTSGEPLPTITNELKGDINDFKNFFEAIKAASPFQVSFQEMPGDRKGYCDPLNHKIVIKSGMSEIQTIKTAIHEITHADLHTGESISLMDSKDRNTKEVEAESVAFVVCKHFDIDTSDYSFPYLASWSSSHELSELKNSFDTIQKQSGNIIDRINTTYDMLINEKSNILNLKNIKSTSLADRLSSAKKIAAERSIKSIGKEKEIEKETGRGEER